MIETIKTGDKAETVVKENSANHTAIRNGDFIEIDFIGRIKSSSKIFDLTLADVAKKEGIFSENHKYKPAIMCVGKRHLVAGIDEFLEGKEIGREYEFEVPPEKAFGKRNPKLVQLAPSNFFTQKKIYPVPGLTLVVDNVLATVRSVSAGRVILDFNHPLAGKTLVYWVKALRKVTKEDEKIQALLSLLLNLEAKVQASASSADGGDKEYVVEVNGRLDDKVIEGLTKHIKELVPEVAEKGIRFIAKKESGAGKQPDESGKDSF